VTLREKLFSFRGRLGRRDWWFLAAALLGVHLAANLLVDRLVPVSLDLEVQNGRFVDHDLIPRWIWTSLKDIPLLWPYAAIAAKRAHDRDKAAWPTLVLLSIVTLAGWTAEFAVRALWNPDATAFQYMLLLWVGAYFVTFIWLVGSLGLLAGSEGMNRFGPPPKSPDPAESFS